MTNTLPRTLLPLLISLFVHMGAASFAQIYVPGLYRDTSLLALLCAAVIIPIMGRFYVHDRKGRLTHPKTKLTWRRGALIFIFGAAASAAAGYLMNRCGIYKRFSNTTQEALFASSRWILVMGPGILVPIAEELTYRVVFYDRLKETISCIPAAILAALVFAIGHGNVIQAIYAFPMALILSLLYEKSSSPAAPILFHMGANLLSVAVMQGVFGAGM